MVSTRMEGRVDNVENEMAGMKVEMATMKVDITTIKEMMRGMTETLAHIEGQNAPEIVPEGSHSVGNRDERREIPNEEGSGENRERRRPILEGAILIVNAIPGDEKLDAVAVCMEGKTLNWLQWLEVRKPVQRWSDFKTKLLRRFHQSQQGNGYEILMAHKQTSDVDEYRERFELLSAPLKEATEEMLIGFYQNGLKEEVRAELRMTQAQNLLDIMDMSQKIEERNEVVEKLREEKLKKALKPNPLPKWVTGSAKPNYPKTFTSTTTPITSNTSGPSNTTESKSSDDRKSSAASNTPSKKNYRRLTDEEIKRKRERGECFTCDDKWSPAHKCKNKRLNIIILSDLEEGEEDGEEFVFDPDETRKDKSVSTLMSLSLNSVVGITSGRTMKLMGKIRGKEVVIMIDSGATHNFISEELVKRMGLEIEKTKSYRVTLGDGYTVQQQGCCKGLEIEMQGLRVCENFYLFNLGDVDMILGVEWLESLGEVRVNWKQLTMKIKAETGVVCLARDPALARSLVSMKNLMRSVRKGGQGLLLELNELALQEEKEQEVDVRIKKVIDDNVEVCNPIEGLPPHRSRDYAIIIKEGEQPPNLRPYHYPHSQKAEIEKLVKEMLTAGYTDLEDWDKEVQLDEKLTRIKQQIITVTAATNGFSLRNGCLTHQGRAHISQVRPAGTGNPNKPAVPCPLSQVHVVGFAPGPVPPSCCWQQWWSLSTLFFAIHVTQNMREFQRNFKN
ncbi:Retrotransposable element Tf2 [Senna tora]|uniref:Retrotransposable element Tf2 n=1 Tax=Senna tora TaxID=362788 RepID=A0A834TU57_9FABA|nr:Retrotransposable element Tf2 [Senna tora]